MHYAQVFIIVLFALCGGLRCAETQKQPANQSDEELVCTEVEVVGSRIPKTVCETPAQAKQREIEAQATLERFQRANSVVIK